MRRSTITEQQHCSTCTQPLVHCTFVGLRLFVRHYRCWLPVCAQLSPVGLNCYMFTMCAGCNCTLGYESRNVVLES